MDDSGNAQCLGSSSGGGTGDRQPNERERGSRRPQERQEVFGDTNLGVLMLILVILHIMQYAMRETCTC